ncbi:MAG: RluA family pseudouridine synthase [Planctomycetota bacterium]|nr:RluA family pseudouridine synthase [Planctomycetota bacterium]
MRQLDPSTVLFEDNHLLVVQKPPGLATMGVKLGDTSLVEQCKEYLRLKYQKPGNVYLGVVSRLDALVSGVVVFARTSKAAARLCEQFRQRDVEKEYWALVSGMVRQTSFHWEDWVTKNEAQRCMSVVAKDTPGAMSAVLEGIQLKTVPGGSLLAIHLVTGRKHQIRVQCAHRMHPIMGDRKYGSSVSFPVGIGLFSRNIRFQHPVQKTPVEVTASPPHAWKPWLAD